MQGVGHLLTILVFFYPIYSKKFLEKTFIVSVTYKNQVEIQGWAAKLTHLASHRIRVVKYSDTNDPPLF
jgi:hypothetical protein